MKIEITQDSLLKAVVTAAKAVPSKSTNPAFENLLFSHQPYGITVTGTDGDIVIIATCEATADEGKFCISAKTILELVKVLPEGEVVIETKEKTATVSWGFGNSELPILSADDFPNVQVNNGESVDVNAAVLRNAISHTLPHVATDILRPQLTGVHFNPIDGHTDLVGSDSHTICVYPIPVTVGRAFTVSAKSLAVVRDSSTEADTVNIMTDGSKVCFLCGNTLVLSTEIVGKFPDYNRVIPTENANTLTADIKEFSQAVRRIAICSNKASNHIKLSLSPMESTVYAQDLGFGTSANETLDVTYEGKELAIGFKHDLLLKTVGGLDGEKFTMKIDNGRKAVLVTSDQDACKAVLMPVAIQ